ncbi:benzoate transporter [Ketogulonicigenium robustum]|uniref:Benzoate transporter n=1 Tax=Ketogulonicigenium robustum TaxID=92947 RepID=A0A1W6P0S5_9RHOB|nr:benzoate/H(+) symporter BenE family transporter [Ketogulonicigenium robustum]ARO14930.1 benzoate transporter [Ketogulonicigenium robustum]
MRVSLFAPALVAALIGYGSSIALVLAAAQALGATPEQTQSWVFALCLGKAVGSIILSVWTRIPTVLAWSTPGAALIAATDGITMAEGVGAFVLVGILIALTGVVRPLGRLIAMIPDALAGAMLAGVLLPFCLQIAGALQGAPMIVGMMVVVYLLARMVNAAASVLVALAAGLALAAMQGQITLPHDGFVLPHLVFIAPTFNLGTVFGLALPLYIVTMAAQNLPGFAVQRAAGYTPNVGRSLLVTGTGSALTGLFGAHTHNMAAITAAICLDPAVHPNPAERWKVALPYGAAWLVLALVGPWMIGLLHGLPPQLLTAVVALGLLAPLAGALGNAMSHPSQRTAATVTILVAASGVSFFGVGAAFWGLVVGLVVHMTDTVLKRAKP